MNIWSIDNAIQEAWERYLDVETGEILEESAFADIEALEMERDRKIENVALWIKNVKAEAEAVKAEKMALAERQAKLERKAESLKRYLAMALHGEKWNNSPKVTINFRKSEVVDVESGAWLDDEYLTFSDPTPNKTAIKKALKSGVEIIGCKLTQKSNVIIK